MDRGKGSRYRLVSISREGCDQRWGDHAQDVAKPVDAAGLQKSQCRERFLVRYLLCEVQQPIVGGVHRLQGLVGEDRVVFEVHGDSKA